MAGRPKRSAEPSFADRLIDAAEELYGTYGIDGVSLRQIGSAAGTSNNNAVQYHFRDVAGLIHAIQAKRVPEGDVRRAELLARLEAEGRLRETRALIDVMFRPFLEQVNSKGERTYAKFTFALLNSAGGALHTGEQFNQSNAGQILALLQAANPEIPPVILAERLRLVTFMILNSVFNRLPPWDRSEFDGALIEDALDSATAALRVPIGDAMREIVRTSDLSAQE